MADINKDMQIMAAYADVKSTPVGIVKLPVYTVSTLPPASIGVGRLAFVSDASLTLILGLGTTVIGGGANKVPVYSDGTNWKIG